MAIWYILWPFGVFYGLLGSILVFFHIKVCCIKKNLATLPALLSQAFRSTGPPLSRRIKCGWNVVVSMISFGSSGHHEQVLGNSRLCPDRHSGLW
jgi:hypothetical protein